MYIYDIITETFVEFYYRDLNKPIVPNTVNSNNMFVSDL